MKQLSLLILQMDEIGFAPHAGRGLKQTASGQSIVMSSFAPHAGRGLKHGVGRQPERFRGFAPHAGRGLKPHSTFAA